MSRTPVQVRVEARAGLSLATRILLCMTLSIVGAHWAVRLPFTPVPATWQVAAALFAGLYLGARAGWISQATYLLLGLAGAPVFAFGNGGMAYLFNPSGTGGYLLALPFAAWLTGLLYDRGERSVHAGLIASAAGLAVVYGAGCLWLGMQLRFTPMQALLHGAGWFLFWDAVKALIALIAAQRLRPGRNAV